MSDLREAAEMALEALNIQTPLDHREFELRNSAIEALRQALAESANSPTSVVESTMAMWQEAYQMLDAKLDELEILTERLALDLECVLLNRDKWWDQACATLQDYRDLMGQWYPQETVSPLGKD